MLFVLVVSAQRTVLVLAELSSAQLSSLRANAERAGFRLHAASKLKAAVASLAATPPQAVLVGLSTSGAEELCAKVRGKRRASDIAIFGAASKLTDLAFAKAFQWGADDVIPLDAARALSVRLSALPADLSVPPVGRGDALVADGDSTRSNIVGRALTNAGYQVKYASDRRSIRQLAAQQDLRLAVVNSDLGFPRQIITEARERGGAATWVVTCHPGDQAAVRRSLEGIERTGDIELWTPPGIGTRVITV